MLGLLSPDEKKAEKPIAKMSDKRKDQEKIYRKKAKAYLVAHPKCEVKGCNRVSEDLHHKAGRVGDLLTNEKYFMAVCRDHHTQIEQDPVWAKEQGYSISRLKNN